MGHIKFLKLDEVDFSRMTEYEALPRISSGPLIIKDPCQDAIKAAIRAIRVHGNDKNFLGFYYDINSGDSPNIQISYCHGYGYYISSFIETDMREKFAADLSLPMSLVEVIIGGCSDYQSRAILVSEEIAIKVAIEFDHSGNRSSECSWLSIDDLPDNSWSSYIKA